MAPIPNVCRVSRHADAEPNFDSAARPTRYAAIRSRRPRPCSSRYSVTVSRAWRLALGLIVVAGTVGCQDDADLVRQIRSERQAQQRLRSQQDHLDEVFVLLRQYVELQPEKAAQQVAYHLNRWAESRGSDQAEVPKKLLASIRDLMPPEELKSRVAADTFMPGDAEHLRDSFLFNRLYSWVDVPANDDPLLNDWFAAQESELETRELEKLRTATRLFDWTVRNIALQPTDVSVPPPDGLQFPFGMSFMGPGYRQSDYQTIMLGIGDGLQRAGVFTQLCRQAGVPAAVLGTIDPKTGSVKPFCVGVLAGEDIYLFEPTLGIFVPGPGQEGIATLAQARSDVLVLRRLGIAGFDQFTYPLAKEDVQQCVALLNLLPETISPRMQGVQSGLTGDRRMNVYVDAASMAKQFDSITGISSVKLWDVPVLAEVYRSVCEAYAERDPLFAFFYRSRWSMLETEFAVRKADYEILAEYDPDTEYGMDVGYSDRVAVDKIRPLLQARWRHLLGRFGDEEEDNFQGARSIYLAHRKPEFEIEDLSIDVDLQKRYGIRRELGVDTEIYNRQVSHIQQMMQLGKRTATYWLSLLQADDGRLETAEGWIAKRVLDEDQGSEWVPAARYNLARLAEQLGETERALDLYKVEGTPQEHGNRIRARLLAKNAE